MKNQRLLRQNFGKSLFILLAVSFVHNAGSVMAIANLPNIFSWLLWLSIGFYLMLYACEFICWSIINRVTQSTAVNFSLFK